MVVEANDGQSYEVQLAQRIYDLDQEQEKINAELKNIKAQKEAEVFKLQEYLVNEGKSSTGHISGVGTFSLRREVYPSVNKCDLPTFIGYLRENGEDGIVKETIAEPTLKAYLKGKIGEMHEWLLENDKNIQTVEKQLNVPEGELAPADLAFKYFERYGVKTFNKIGISITKKGKE